MILEMCTNIIKAFEISQVFNFYKVKRNNTMFSIFIFNKALKLHILLKSTMVNNNKNNLDAFSFNQDTFIKNLESKIQSSYEEKPQSFKSKLWQLVCKTKILMQIVSL